MQTETDPDIALDAAAAEPPVRFGLSGKLLILTIFFVMLAEVLIYVPSIANFRMTWLNDRLAAAHTAALVLDAAPSGMVPESLAQQILDSIGARAVAMKIGQQRRLLATSNLPQRGAAGGRRPRHGRLDVPSSRRSAPCSSTGTRTSSGRSGRRRWAASSSRS